MAQSDPRNRRARSLRILREPRRPNTIEAGGATSGRRTTNNDKKYNQQTTGSTLEASHEMITEDIVSILNQETNTEVEEDTPLYRGKVQFIAAATR